MHIVKFNSVENPIIASPILHRKSTHLINEMSGRKRSKDGQAAGCSPGDRVTTWFTHFRDLLGTHPRRWSLDGAEEEISAVLRDLKIDDGPFTISELAAVKSTLKQGKSARRHSLRGP